MPTLECPDVFSMLVPDGWSATGFGDLKYQLLKDGDDTGAVNVSAYLRGDAPLGPNEARDLIGRFLGSLRPEDGGQLRVLPESKDQHRAVTRCQTRDETGDATDWLVFLVLWRPAFVVCTCNATVGSPMLDEAEQMFASIHRPEEQRRGRFRRR